MKSLNISMIENAVKNNVIRRKREPDNDFLKRITSLSLTSMNLSNIELISKCENLTTLYLSDNHIQDPTPLSQCTKLERLFLQNNEIDSLDGFQGLKYLTVLYLSKNRIQKFKISEEAMPSLEKLVLDDQRIESPMEFDAESLDAVNGALMCLQISGNKLETLNELASLTELRELDASRNRIKNLSDISVYLNEAKELSTINLNENPLMASIKMRQKIISKCTSLECLNGKEVSEPEKEFIKNMNKIRSQINSRNNSMAELPPIPIEPKMKETAVPHLPPFASQYRDFIQQKVSQQTRHPLARGDSLKLLGKSDPSFNI